MGTPELEHPGIHQLSPQQRAPVVRLRRQRDVIEEAVVARDQRVVGDDLDSLPGEAAELVEIAERVEERASRRIAAACGIRGFREPQRLAGRERVAQLAVEGQRRVGAPQPLLRERARQAVVCAPMAAQRRESAP